MQLAKYQERALSTDHTAKRFDTKIDRGSVVSLLGLAGELGTLCATYKKYLRDGKDYQFHKYHIKEELGDILWYLAVVADKFGFKLDDVAKFNIEKIDGRWKEGVQAAMNYDKGMPKSQKLPRKFKITVTQHTIDGKTKAVMCMNDTLLGDPLTDNADEADGYRFHDAFHVAFLTVLGWSPVLRKLMNKKRKKDPQKDENEDGGRAIVIEEGIAALIFEYGSDNGLASGRHIIDDELLLVLRQMTRRLEIKKTSSFEWQKAVLLGWKTFSWLNRNMGGSLICDMDDQTILLRKPTLTDRRKTEIGRAHV